MNHFKIFDDIINKMGNNFLVTPHNQIQTIKKKHNNITQSFIFKIKIYKVKYF